ncbi:alpha/beta fold hydrolase [Cohnella nanjingensis]|uniref:Alpha/beta hydrolase n=1 Tax=Cohnella nanjingensis TaxID=1387779 RepID=A0A7X0RRC5_9BACL|nr:alpha/beta hydrolase [Cohnella nanjingensis]MBB6672140.1 alpha/beta hydrolase [Cohnella nanjingensis]
MANGQEKTGSSGAQEQVGYAFVSGAGLRGGIWNEVVEGFDEPCLALEYPARDAEAEERRSLSLEDYVAELKRQLERWEVERFILVAHSLGGALALRLAAEMPDRVAGFAAVGAAIPRGGGSFLSALPWPKRLLLSVILRRAGTRPPASAIRAGLCNDLPAAQADIIVRDFVPESVRVYTDRTEAPMPEAPKLYVKLAKDKEFGSALQDRMRANLSPDAVRSLDTGHLPMLGDPQGLRLALQSFRSEYVLD